MTIKKIFSFVLAIIAMHGIADASPCSAYCKKWNSSKTDCNNSPHILIYGGERDGNKGAEELRGKTGFDEGKYYICTCTWWTIGTSNKCKGAFANARSVDFKFVKPDDLTANSTSDESTDAPA